MASSAAVGLDKAQTQPNTSERFSSLPAEIKRAIYHCYFDYIKVNVRARNVLPVFWDNHVANCPGLNLHSTVKDGEIYTCQDSFDLQISTFQAPGASRLSLLTVNREIYHDAIEFLYKRSNLVLNDCLALHDFFERVPTHLMHITELTFKYKSKGATKAFNTIAGKCTGLKYINIVFDVGVRNSGIDYTQNKPQRLRYAVGMEALLRIRGIKNLQLVGEDRLLGQEGEFLDYLPLTEPRTIGRILRQQLILPNSLRLVEQLSGVTATDADQDSQAPHWQQDASDDTNTGFLSLEAEDTLMAYGFDGEDVYSVVSPDSVPSGSVDPGVTMGLPPVFHQEGSQSGDTIPNFDNDESRSSQNNESDTFETDESGLMGDDLDRLHVDYFGSIAPGEVGSYSSDGMQD